MTNCAETPIQIGNGEIEYCREYIYLGHTVSYNINYTTDRRVALSWKKIWNLKFIVLDKSMNIKIKRNVMAYMYCHIYYTELSASVVSG